jgi:glycosyltransferase involved in cell wall biosynthesis
MCVDLSFVIPAYNEESLIGNLLHSIQVTITGIRYEIIVVDNGSTDNTAIIAKSNNVTVISISKSTVSVARNIGAKLAIGGVIAFLDADVRITVGWGEEIVRKLAYIRTEAVLTGSRYLIPENPSRIEHDWFLPLSMKNINYINGGNLVIGKKTFSEVGGFDESIISGEDYELSKRAVKKGATVVNNPGLEAIHDGYPKNLFDFIKREFWHGKGDCQKPELFFKSKVALTAVIFGILHVSLIALLFYGSYIPSAVVGGLIAVVSFFMSVRVFSDNGFILVLKNILLCYLYLMSRFMSFLSVIWNLYWPFFGQDSQKT